MVVLIIGVRRKCYRAALRLGHEVVIWSDGPLHKSRKKRLKGWIEIPYANCSSDLNAEAQRALLDFSIDRVIANTEETVVLGARVRRFLGLKSLAVNVVERFHNKFIMKNCVSEIDIPITKYKLIDASTTPRSLASDLGFPVVIKPVDDSGAQDVKILYSEAEIEKHMRPGLLAEAFVKGSELSVETFIQDGKIIFHNLTEYLHQWRKSVVPAHLDANLRAQIISINDKIIEHLGVDRGMTHAEFYLTDNGPIFGEVAIRPPGGYYMELIEQVYGFDPWELYVQLSCNETPSVPPSAEPNGCAAVVMFHPGAGTIREINGVDEIKRQLPHLLEFKFLKEVGDQLFAHENTSNETGHLLFWSDNREDLLQQIRMVEETLEIKLDP